MEPADVLAGMLDLKVGQPVVTFIAKQTVEHIVRERLKVGAEKLQARMAKGLPGMYRENEFASLVFDYLRAAEDGTAQDNLEIMADLIANGVGDEAMTEAAIRHLMKIVAGLSYDELRVLAAFTRAIRALEPTGGGIADVFMHTSSIWSGVWKELEGSDNEPSVDRMATTESYVRTFALARTGLVVAHSAWGAIVFGPGPELLSLERLSDVASLMARAEHAQKAGRGS